MLLLRHLSSDVFFFSGHNDCYCSVLEKLYKVFHQHFLICLCTLYMILYMVSEQPCSVLSS